MWYVKHLFIKNSAVYEVSDESAGGGGLSSYYLQSAKLAEDS